MTTDETRLHLETTLFEEPAPLGCGDDEPFHLQWR